MNKLLFTSSAILTFALVPFLASTGNTNAPDTLPVQGPPQKPQQEPPKSPLVLINSTQSNNSVSLIFSDFVSKDAFDKSVSVSPAVKFETVQNSNYSFSLNADFKPGETYAVRIAASLAGNSTAELGQEAVVAFTAKDSDPEIDFLSDGKFFPLCAPDFSLPIQIRNAGKVRITVRQAYDDSTVQFFRYPGDRDFSKEIFFGEVEPDAQRNKEERYSVALEKIGIPRKPGIYRVKINSENTQYRWYYNRDRTRTLIVTDLAIQATGNGNELAVAVKNISGNAAVPAAKISIYSRKNRLIFSGECDENGFAKIALPPIEDNEDEAYTLLAEKDGDKTLLPISYLAECRKENEFTENEARAHVFPERGICRPGEEIHLFANLRDGKEKTARGNVPAEFHISDPSGNSLSRIPVVGDAFGFYKTSVKIPDFAATGTYRVSLRIPGQEESTYGSARFAVGEYVPDTLNISLASKLEDAAVSVSGNVAYYFGMPLTDGNIRLSREIRYRVFRPKGNEFAEFDFGLNEASLPQSFSDSATTTKSDEQGNFSGSFANAPDAGKPVPYVTLSVITASASGSAGGRTVSATDVIPMHSSQFYFGTREQASSATERVFEICTLSPKSSRISVAGKKFKASLERLEWNYVVRKSNSGSHCLWQEENIPAGEIEFDGGDSLIKFPMAQGGNYRLSIRDEAGNLIHTRNFWHYYGETGSRSKNLAQLSFRLDREKYLPGESATITFDSPFSGNAVLLTGTETIESMREIEVRVGENNFEVPIPAGTASGCYFFSVTASGKTDAKSPELICRTFGTGVLPVDQRARKIFVKTEIPEIIRPGEKTKMRVTLSDASGKPVSGTLQIWAVDRGVLALNNFETPNSFSYFFGTYDCPYRFKDNYANFYPLLSLDREIFGGGKPANLSKFTDEKDHSKKSAVVVLDTLKVPASGEVEAEFSPPDFDGSMRIMAFALNEDKLGSGEKDVIVRDLISLQLTAPRAVAPGDDFEIIAEVFNTDSSEHLFSWEMLFDGKTIASGNQIPLKKGEKHIIKKKIVAGEICGAKKAELIIRNSAGEICTSSSAAIEPATVELRWSDQRESASISVRTPFPPRDRVVFSEIAPGSEAHFENADSHGEVALGSPALAITGALDWLDKYPYGCLEQVSAAAFPHLSVNALASQGMVPAVFAESSATKVRAGLAKISTMRTYNGQYSMWPNDSRVWTAGTLFAIHFELEADANGFPLSESRRAEIKNVLEKISDSKQYTNGESAYAVYLLALAGERRAAAFAKRLLYENKLGDFSRFLLGATLVESGYASEGMKTLLPLLEKDFWLVDEGQYDSCLDSDIRRAGIVLHVLSKIAPDAPANRTIARYLHKGIAQNGHWGSTQKNAWAVYGLSAYFGSGNFGTERGILKIDGAETELKGSMLIPGGKCVSLKNVGESPIWSFVRTREKPKAFEPVANKFEIRREYFDQSGNPVTSCNTGDLLTVKIRVRAQNYFESAVICDLLPGGLEIEDETLATRAQAPENSSGGSGSFYESARERRFDRFLAFGTFSPAEKWSELTYRVRATSRGKFTIPPVQVESMYEGEKRAAWQPEVTIFEVK